MSPFGSEIESMMTWLRGQEWLLCDGNINSCNNSM